MQRKTRTKNARQSLHKEWIPDTKTKRLNPVNSGYRYWTINQNKVYLNYLKTHFQVVMDEQARKKAKIFKEISKLLKTRSAVQVKSHHQKMMKMANTIEQLIAFLEEATVSQITNNKLENNIILQVQITSEEAETQETFQMQENIANSHYLLKQSIFTVEGEQGLLDFLKFQAQQSFPFHHNHQEWELQI